MPAELCTPTITEGLYVTGSNMSRFICSVDLSGGSETDKLGASETMPRQEEGGVCTSMAVQVWTQEGVWSRQHCLHEQSRSLSYSLEN